MKKGKLIKILVILFVFLIGFVSAEKLGIQVKDNYTPGENLNFKIILYDNNNNEISGRVNFEIRDPYNNITQGTVNSGEIINYNLPNDAWRGLWEIIANYNDIEQKEYFGVLELEKADIKLEGQLLIIKNIGNVPYKKLITISIGDNKETWKGNALVPLDVGESKKIKLTGNGSYDIRVNDGTQEDDLVFESVALTGNVIGVKRVDVENPLKKYPLIILFFLVIMVAIVIITVSRVFNS